MEGQKKGYELVITKEQVEGVLSKRLIEVFNRIEDKVGQFETEKDWEYAGVTRKDYFLRQRFWRLINQARYENKKLNVTKLIDGIYTKYTFYEALKNDTRASYIFTKPHDYVMQEEYLLAKTSEKMLDIANLDPWQEGVFNKGIAELQFKLHKFLTENLKGKPITRIQQHSVTENISSDKKALSKMNDISVIEAEISRLENPDE